MPSANGCRKWPLPVSCMVHEPGGGAAAHRQAECLLGYCKGKVAAAVTGCVAVSHISRDIWADSIRLLEACGSNSSSRRISTQLLARSCLCTRVHSTAYMELWGTATIQCIQVLLPRLKDAALCTRRAGCSAHLTSRPHRRALPSCCTPVLGHQVCLRAAARWARKIQGWAQSRLQGTAAEASDAGAVMMLHVCSELRKCVSDGNCQMMMWA